MVCRSPCSGRSGCSTARPGPRRAAAQCHKRVHIQLAVQTCLGSNCDAPLASPHPSRHLTLACTSPQSLTRSSTGRYGSGLASHGAGLRKVRGQGMYPEKQHLVQPRNTEAEAHRNRQHCANQVASTPALVRHKAACLLGGEVMHASGAALRYQASCANEQQVDACLLARMISCRSSGRQLARTSSHTGVRPATGRPSDASRSSLAKSACWEQQHVRNWMGAQQRVNHTEACAARAHLHIVLAARQRRAVGGLLAVSKLAVCWCGRRSQNDCRLLAGAAHTGLGAHHYECTRCVLPRK